MQKSINQFKQYLPHLRNFLPPFLDLRSTAQHLGVGSPFYFNLPVSCTQLSRGLLKSKIRRSSQVGSTKPWLLSPLAGLWCSQSHRSYRRSAQKNWLIPTDHARVTSLIGLGHPIILVNKLGHVVGWLSQTFIINCH